VVKTKSKRACPVCGTLFPDDSESCPVCALQGALKPESDASSIKDARSESELRFEHYRVLQNEDGTPIELGHGAMGVTYKAFDVHLQCPVALKIINARFIGDDSARLLEALLAKDPSQPFEGPAQLQKALSKVREAIGSESRLTANELRLAADQVTEELKRRPRRHALKWLIVSRLCLVGLPLGWFFFGYWGAFSKPAKCRNSATREKYRGPPF
jgi:hypothetical protein